MRGSGFEALVDSRDVWWWDDELRLSNGLRLKSSRFERDREGEYYVCVWVPHKITTSHFLGAAVPVPYFFTSFVSHISV